jgi:hypothetical protein
MFFLRLISMMPSGSAGGVSNQASSASVAHTENTSPGFHISIHLHLPGIDGRVQDYPSTAAQLSIWHDVDKYRLIVC